MDRSIKEIKDMLKKLSMTADEIRQTNGGHIRVVVRKGDETRIVFFPHTGSDHRWTLNKIAELRQRFNQPTRGKEITPF